MDVLFLKIVQIYSQFLPSIGGIQVVMYNLAKRLVKGGHEVVVLTSNVVGESSSDLLSEEITNGIRVIRARVLPTKLFRKLAFTPSIVPELFSTDADVFHVFSFLPHFITNIACIISKLRRVPLVVTPVYHPHRQLLYTNLTGKLVRAVYDDFIGLNLLKNANCVIALTEDEARYYREREVGNVRVIPVGVDLNEHKSESEEVEKFRERFNLSGRVILCVGRLKKQKGIQYAIKAMSLVSREFVDAKLLIVGADEGYQNQLKDLTRDLNVEKRVIFTEGLSFSELSCAYELADMVVVPSIFEAFSLIVIEAWAHKKPTIASKTIGLAEIISADAGILVNYSNHKVLAKAMLKLLQDQSLARSMGTRGYQIVKEGFTWEKIVDKLEEVYRSVAEGGQ